MRRLLLVAWALCGFGCGVQGAEVGAAGDDSDVAQGQLLGENGNDAADRACNVVLRTVGRVPNTTGGFQTSCGSGGCDVVFAGTLDVSQQALSEGATPYVLYKNQDDAGWSKASATAAPGAPGGFARYQFQLTKQTISDGLSLTSLQRAKLLVIPYLLTTSKARVFDHNRVPGDFDDYELSSAGAFTVADDPSACPGQRQTRASLDFRAGWQQSQTLALVQQGHATITYDISRLPDCRGTHNGYPAWDVRAFVRFSPGGQQLDGTVRGFDSPNGVPSNSGAKSVPFDFDIPAGATSAEIWFENFTGAGSSCVAWDSNLGANYHFTVEAQPPAAVGWVGNAGSSFDRACTRYDGVPDPLLLNDYILERACTFVEVDVYVPGLTDGAAQKPEDVWAQTALELDGQALAPAAMSFAGRFGNNYRFHYDLDRWGLYYGAKWSTLRYTPRFSTDGVTWTSEQTRTVTRDPSFCNPAWSGCN